MTLIEFCLNAKIIAGTLRHEDLRLDELLMQFFRLIQLLMMKDAVFNRNVIQAVNIIPLSMFPGFGQWTTGTARLQAATEPWRRLNVIDPLRECSIV
jgi:hypothetical protein